MADIVSHRVWEGDGMPKGLSEVIRAALLDRLSQVGMEVYELLFIAERSVAEICDWTGITPDDLFAWRNRIRAEMIEIVLQVEAWENGGEGMGAVAC